MQSSRFRFLRGLIGTSLTWGLAWSALNTGLKLARGLLTVPEGESRAERVYVTLRYVTPAAFFWGCLFGIAFSLLVAAAARRWPTAAPLQNARLTAFGALAGLAVSSIAVGFGSLLHLTGIAVCGVIGAGFGAAFAHVARPKASQSIDSSDLSKLPSV